MVGLAVTTPLLLLDWRAPSPLGWALLAGSGLCFGLAQLCLAAAFRHAPAALLAPFTYTQIVPAVRLGFLPVGAEPEGAAPRRAARGVRARRCRMCGPRSARRW